MELGNKIKALRTAKGITQETLAAVLSVSAQAVSKWETGVTTPDIQLLPEIAVYFGTTIDELFCLADEKELDRIQNMLWESRLLTPAQMDKAERWLLDKIKADVQPDRCYFMLAQLHNHQAAMHHEIAAEYAKESVKRDPTSKDGLYELIIAMGGAGHDWYMRDHHDLIEVLRGLIRENPQLPRLYQWLMDNLIDDQRFDEAREALEKMRALDNDFRVPLYDGLIFFYQGDREKAREIWTQMEADFPDEWMVAWNRGEQMAMERRYDEAIAYFRKALDVQKAPRWTDPLESIAHVCKFTGNRTMAIEALEEEIRIVNTEWDTHTGETVDRLRRMIRQLQTKE